jgi:hypothetical protein
VNSSLVSNADGVERNLSLQLMRVKARGQTPARNLARLRTAVYSGCAFGILLFAWDFADRLDHRVIETTTRSQAMLHITAQNALMPVSSRPTVSW